MECDWENIKIEVVEGDITEIKADCIVNAANSYLKHGGGVAYAIVKKGGYEIQRESDEYVKTHGPVKTGEVAVTGPGKLKCRYIIHAVGPRYGEGDDLLYSAIKNSLEKADELNSKSIALPAISTGIFGYPLDICAKIMVKAIKDFKGKSLERIMVVLYDKNAYEIFSKIFSENFRCKGL